MHNKCKRCELYEEGKVEDGHEGEISLKKRHAKITLLH